MTSIAPTVSALSIHQPWAWLIVAGHKPIENRTWAPPRNLIGKRIVIHATRRQKDFEDQFDAAEEVFLEANPESDISDFGPIHHSSAIGSAILDGYVTSSDSPWFFGPIGWVFRNPILWESPVLFQGAQGIWKFPCSMLPAIEWDYRNPTR